MKKKTMIAVCALIVLISFFFAVKGVSMHFEVDREKTKLHELQEDYYSVDKATRDEAPSNTKLTQQLVEINYYSSEIMRLKLVGIGKLLVGIYLLLLGILVTLIVLPERLGRVIRKKMK